MVGRLKWQLRQAGSRAKIGHGGTLDPLASGLLPIAVGEATKLAQYALDGDKEYDFTIRFGHETETDDAEGAPTRTNTTIPTADTLTGVLPAFRGPILQRPPAYSAIKVAGRRAYARARAGEAVALPARPVTIRALELLALDGAEARLRVRCSKGTYVRSLARDIARAAGAAGHVGALRRTAVAGFAVGDAIALDKLTELVQEHGFPAFLLPLATGLDDIPVLAVDEKEACILRHGGRLPHDDAWAPGRHLATDREGIPIALVEVDEGRMRVIRGLNL